MAKHIISFSKLKDQSYVKPKDKIPWILKDLRKNPYKLLRERFIYKNNRRFVHPNSFPED